MKKITFSTLIIFTTLFLLSCGGTNSAATAEQHQVSWHINGNDSFEFTPNELSVPAGTEVNLTFTNGGQLEHNFIVTSSDVDLFSVTEADALGEMNTGIVEAGADMSITFDAPTAGRYTFVCVVPGHAAGGMAGTLTVTDGESDDVAGE